MERCASPQKRVTREALPLEPSAHWLKLGCVPERETPIVETSSDIPDVPKRSPKRGRTRRRRLADPPLRCRAGGGGTPFSREPFREGALLLCCSLLLVMMVSLFLRGGGGEGKGGLRQARRAAADKAPLALIIHNLEAAFGLKTLSEGMLRGAEETPLRRSAPEFAQALPPAHLSALSALVAAKAKCELCTCSFSEFSWLPDP